MTRPRKGPPPGWSYQPCHDPPPVDLAACAALTPAEADRMLYPAIGRGRRGDEHDAHHDDGRILCQGCPVQTSCLDYALTEHEVWGMWGGCTEAERHELRRHLGLMAYGYREPLYLVGSGA